MKLTLSSKQAFRWREVERSPPATAVPQTAQAARGAPSFEVCARAMSSIGRSNLPNVEVRDWDGTFPTATFLTISQPPVYRIAVQHCFGLRWPCAPFAPHRTAPEAQPARNPAIAPHPRCRFRRTSHARLPEYWQIQTPVGLAR
ncbi:hypothetical protein CKAH01_01628 [Colletotrichum kahawae]|uniref:Uncharacterized protein n=1 Tax=Colletotrichum kahawae TaxID=34407 RepID=A0AAD9Y7U5_COLKA|nr:hypothetical protein CKAH01_01628 [Colletotrichum kahawae]